MLTPTLPECVNPHLLAEENVVLEGDIPLPRFTRLTDYLCERCGAVRITLQFHKGKHRPLLIIGKARTTLTMQCQYCLDPVEVAVEADLDLVYVERDESSASLDESADGILAEGDSIDLVAIVEDDLILSLPMVARHGSGDCIGKLEYHQDEAASEGPFAELERLKKRLRDA